MRIFRRRRNFTIPLLAVHCPVPCRADTGPAEFRLHGLLEHSGTASCTVPNGAGLEWSTAWGAGENWNLPSALPIMMCENNNNAYLILLSFNCVLLGLLDAIHWEKALLFDKYMKIV